MQNGAFVARICHSDGESGWDGHGRADCRHVSCEVRDGGWTGHCWADWRRNAARAELGDQEVDVGFAVRRRQADAKPATPRLTDQEPHVMTWA